MHLCKGRKERKRLLNIIYFSPAELTLGNTGQLTLCWDNAFTVAPQSTEMHESVVVCSTHTSITHGA